MQPEAAGPSLVDELQRTVARELGDHPVDGILLGTDGGDIDHRVTGRRPDPRYGDRVLVHIQTHEHGAIVIHADLR